MRIFIAGDLYMAQSADTETEEDGHQIVVVLLRLLWV
jgi:hypothetical protein